MPAYDFSTLSPLDFEDLVRDVLNEDLGLRLHSYRAGPDQGIDLRGEDPLTGETIVVQCKRYIDSSDSTFINALQQEAGKAIALGQVRYILVVARRMSPQLQDKIFEALQSVNIKRDDIWGRESLNAALGRVQHVERRHFKLWLTSVGVLQTVIEAGIWQRSEALLQDLAQRARVWVQTPSFFEVQNLLSDRGVCIVCGPPGSGKTSIADAIVLSSLADNWQIIHVSDDIEEAWASIRDDDSRQLFYYDDFLGQGALDLRKNESSRLAQFVAFVEARRPRKRLIMTTRDYELSRAISSSDDRLRRVSKQSARHTLALAPADTTLRKNILYNHVDYSDLPREEQSRLRLDNRLLSVLEHSAFSPRLIRYAIERPLANVDAEEVFRRLQWALDNPDDLWAASFELIWHRGIAVDILLHLATLPPRPWPLEAVKTYVRPSSAHIWVSALRALEPTWVRVLGIGIKQSIVLSNPSCRDFLLTLFDESNITREWLGKVARLEQLVFLGTHSGLLPPEPGGSSQECRPLLMEVLKDSQDELERIVRRLTSYELGIADDAGRVRALLHAVRVLCIFGTAASNNWILEDVEGLIGDIQNTPRAPSCDFFSLAGWLSSMPANEPDRVRSSVDSLLRLGVRGIRNLGDLDAYESVSVELRTSDVQREVIPHADQLIRSELDYIAFHSNDHEFIDQSIRELQQRARWYGLDF
ncbi:restriction endonuclease [Nonomuraea sp. NPDC049269]|uniref:nSTAND3 domain-containing NTPase n=1 Tax=Nonomuraea sp. NPDC049269 TaxID=3364349 RepID=UPI00371C13B6